MSDSAGADVVNAAIISANKMNFFMTASKAVHDNNSGDDIEAVRHSITVVRETRAG